MGLTSHLLDYNKMQNNNNNTNNSTTKFGNLGSKTNLSSSSLLSDNKVPTKPINLNFVNNTLNYLKA